MSTDRVDETHQYADKISAKLEDENHHHHHQHDNVHYGKRR
ncbi:unnamed protein product, partial [Rotaria magnacalcarata]